MRAVSDDDVEITGERSIRFHFVQLSEQEDTVEVRFDRAMTGRPVAVTLRVHDGVRASDMRRLPWNQWFRGADWILRSRLADGVTGTLDVDEISLVTARWDDKGKPIEPPLRRPGRRGHPAAFYREVADRYQAFMAEGATDPTARLAKERQQSRATVAGWVGKARRLGYLPPARPGRPG